MSDEIGAVVVGTGFGVLTHLRALRQAGFDVKALVGRDPEKTRSRAEGAGVAHGLTSLSEALALPGVEAVTIATPPHTHAAIAIEAAKAGKHILCEKPMARDADEAQTMLEAAEEAGIVHLLGTEFRFSTGQAHATRAIHEGVIGEPRLATFMMHVGTLADPSGEVPAWWSDAREGGGWLGAYSSHVLDQLRVTLGEFSGLSASLSLVSDRDWSAEDTFTVHFETHSGVAGVLQSSAGSWGPPIIHARIAGSKGTLWIQGDQVMVADKDGQRALETPPELVNDAPSPPPAELLHTAYDMMHAMGLDLAPFTKLFEIFRARIRGESYPEDPAAGTFADGVAAMRLLDAIRHSHTHHTWVPL